MIFGRGRNEMRDEVDDDCIIMRHNKQRRTLLGVYDKYTYHWGLP